MVNTIQLAITPDSTSVSCSSTNNSRQQQHSTAMSQVAGDNLCSLVMCEQPQLLRKARLSILAAGLLGVSPLLIALQQHSNATTPYNIASHMSKMCLPTPTLLFFLRMAFNRPLIAGNFSPMVPSLSCTLPKMRRCSSKLRDTDCACASMSST
jgi:hypothetical protein